MAVTISEYPSDYLPSDNPLRFTFSSTQTAQANFSFIVQTYFNAALVSEDRVFPESGSYAHFDVSPIVKNLFDKPVIGADLYQESGIYAEISITVIENYGTPPTNQANQSSTTIPIFKGCLSDRDWLAFDAGDFMVASVGAKFMTPFADVTQRLYRERNVPFVLQAINQGNAEELEIELWNSGGLIASNSDIQTFNICQVVITDALLVSDLGFNALDVAAAEYIKVFLNQATFTVYNYDESCPGEPSTLQWVNQYGSFDSFVFAHNIVRSGDITERTYMRKFGQWNGTSYEYDVTDAGMQRVGTQQTDKLTIYTDWISDDVQNVLTTLYKAPKHLLYIDGVDWNVKLVSNQFTFAQQRFEEEVTEAVELQISTNHKGLSL